MVMELNVNHKVIKLYAFVLLEPKVIHLLHALLDIVNTMKIAPIMKHAID